ncbi:MAG: hemin ABC transporter substrate-binding protein, partial [Mesorhizobium sp.]
MAPLLKRARVFRTTLGATIGLCLAFAALLSARAAEGTEVFADPSKIAAIGGSITEIIFALGEQDRLVARDSTSNYP